MNKLLLILGAAVLLTATFKLMNGNNAEVDNQVIRLFKNWTMKHSKSYTSHDEKMYRMQVFANNLKQIADMNNDNDGASYEMNQFGDLTSEEFKQIYLGTTPSNTDEINMVEYSEVYNLGSINWVDKGDVQKVKNQGQCGSCWAFSTTAVTESAYAVSGKGLQNLAEQQLVDCSRSYGNYGCNGGWPSNGLKFTQDKGLVDESKYPYVARDQTCKIATGDYKIKSQTGSKDCNSLKTALNKQPISVCVDATNWQFYSSGIFSNCRTSINHAVLAAGYQDGSYWLIKNSWGTGWGEKGYIRLADGNTCAVCSIAVWPSV